MTITQQPSPDWNMVTLKWAATNLDGTPTTGTIDLIYNSLGPMLDDDPVTPVSIYPKLLRVPISTTTINIWEGDYDSAGAPIPGTGAFVQRTVGYLEVKVPASNDPDIIGAGGTYAFTENLNGVPGRRNVVFAADKDAPGRTIWLNRLPGGVAVPAEPYSVVYWSEFLALREAVEDLEAPPVATTTTAGLVRRSTAAEAAAGDSVNAYVTPEHLADKVSGISIPQASTTEAGKVELATTAEATSGTDTARATTPAGVKAVVDAMRTTLLGGASAAWDTLQELKALIDAAEESSLIDALTTVVGGKLQKDQNLADLPDKAQARANLGVFTDTQQIVRWTGSAWPARPAGAAFGVAFLSTNDPAATPPPAAGLLLGDRWIKHPDAS